MSAKSPECYTTDPKAECLRVEVSPGHSFLLPHDEFAFAELKTEEKEQYLRLIFAEHEVLVRGYCLRRIETALQRMELSFLSALSTNQRSLVPDGQPVIVEIAVTEANPQHAHLKEDGA